MTPQEVIDHTEMALEAIEAKNFYRSTIECAKKAIIVDEAIKLAARIKPEDIPWKVEEGDNGNGNDR